MTDALEAPASFALTGHVALVTGAGSGIGQRIAKALLKAAGQASSYCTGIDLLVDGGFCRW